MEDDDVKNKQNFRSKVLKSLNVKHQKTVSPGKACDAPAEGQPHDCTGHHGGAGADRQGGAGPDHQVRSEAF